MKKILIVRLTALGDIVNSSIVIQLINNKFDNIQIDWLCEDINKELATSIIGINRVHTISLKKLKKSRSFSELKKTINYLKNLPKYEMVIDMQGLLKSSIVSKLVSNETYGYDKNSSRESLSSLFYKYQFNKSYESNVIERNIFLTCSALKCTINSDEIVNKEPIFQVNSDFTCSAVVNEKRNIALVIGASWESKKYPLDKFIELINSNLDYNFLVLSGNKSEYSDAKYIASKSQSTAIEPSSIKNLISLISK
ncbi:MAG: glycosyltransferase family 9 protein, partial [Campylobacterota bacterium]|nr:glycosyltransferase family 9 protein [Campylobacterota bacterium]